MTMQIDDLTRLIVPHCRGGPCAIIAMNPDVMRKPIALSLLLCAALPACHRNSAPPDDSTPGERVTGAERLGWDQQASDTAQLASFSYAVYLDGVRSELGGVSCASTPAVS